jgi:hypothetical protein
VGYLFSGEQNRLADQTSSGEKPGVMREGDDSDGQGNCLQGFIFRLSGIQRPMYSYEIDFTLVRINSPQSAGNDLSRDKRVCFDGFARANSKIILRGTLDKNFGKH